MMTRMATEIAVSDVTRPVTNALIALRRTYRTCSASRISFRSTALTCLVRSISCLPSIPGPAGQAGNPLDQQTRGNIHHRRDDEQDEAQFDDGTKVDRLVGFDKLVGDGAGNGIARREQRWRNVLCTAAD